MPGTNLIEEAARSFRQMGVGGVAVKVGGGQVEIYTITCVDEEKSAEFSGPLAPMLQDLSVIREASRELPAFEFLLFMGIVDPLTGQVVETATGSATGDDSSKTSVLLARS